MDYGDIVVHLFDPEERKNYGIEKLWSDKPFSDYAKYVNMQAVKQFGGNFDKKAFEGFDVLVEEDGTSHFNK